MTNLEKLRLDLQEDTVERLGNAIYTVMIDNNVFGEREKDE